MAEVDSCQRCKSNRLLMAGGKTSDMSYYSLGEREHHGYNLPVKNISRGGDYLDIVVCLECGQLQGKWPVGIPDALCEEQS